ncbi:MAG: hypothetical protein K9N01_14540 [Cephaloticoccus sp.]|nr:hypothetical protein [Cephaloticoccus sp.]
MKPLLETTLKHAIRRRRMPRLSRDPEVRSIQIGVLGTVLVHLLLFLIVPYLLKFEHTGALGTVPVAPQFNIELMPEETMPLPEVKETPPPFKFVEVNPDAPDNVPDTTENFGAQNQQAAQEKESPDMSSDRPALDGQTEIQTDRIVSGQLSPQTPPMPSAPPQEEQPAEQEQTMAAKREQIPLSGYEKSPDSTAEGYGSNIAQLPDGDHTVNEKMEGMKDAPLTPSATSMTIRINPSKPLPRPTLEKRARPAIFTENKVGTANIGPTAVDARWSNYGQYLQQLIETVQIQWDRILIQSQVYPTSGTRVVVKFMLNSKGEVSRIIGVEGTAGDLGKQSCVGAITTRSPYGDWTEDMISVLGNSQEMTFTFYYQ